MPKALERELFKRARKYAKSGKLKRRKGETKAEAIDAYVYGTLRKTGWKPSREK